MRAFFPASMSNENEIESQVAQSRKYMDKMTEKLNVDNAHLMTSRNYMGSE